MRLPPASIPAWQRSRREFVEALHRERSKFIRVHLDAAVLGRRNPVM